MNHIVRLIKNMFLFSFLVTLTACGMGQDNTEIEETPTDVTETQTDNSSNETEESDDIADVKDEEKVEEVAAVESVSEFQWLYDELNEKSFIFSSGVGAWRTSFTFDNNGSFTGKFSDANGLDIMVSEFTGEFVIEEEIDEFTYILDLSNLQVVSDTGTEEVDGEMTITYVDEPHGFQSGSQKFELYLPYKPKDQVSDEYLSWVHGQASNDYEFLNSFGLYNLHHEFGMEELFN